MPTRANALPVKVWVTRLPTRVVVPTEPPDAFLVDDRVQPELQRSAQLELRLDAVVDQERVGRLGRHDDARRQPGDPHLSLIHISEPTRPY